MTGNDANAMYRAALEGLRWRIYVLGGLVLGGSWLLLYSPVLFFGTLLWWGKNWAMWDSEAGPAIIAMVTLIVGLLLGMGTMQLFVSWYADKRRRQIMAEYYGAKE